MSKVTSSIDSFKPLATGNLAVYFGHSTGNNYARLLDVCTAASPDIVILSFIRNFNGPSLPPTVDFGSRCKFPGGQAAPCPSMAAEVQQCQQHYHKKVFISVGGSDNSIDFSSERDAIDSAHVLWNTFGAGMERPNVSILSNSSLLRPVLIAY